MAIPFTPQQEKAIQLHGCNILVSAAAGSGKTAVLAERIIKMVCDGDVPVDIDRLLVVTFTKAAASEMRERIAKGLAERLREHPGDEHLQRQSALLHNAQITTFDSFALFLVRNHFNEIGVDPAFRVAEEGEGKLLKQEVLEKLLEDAFASGEEAFTHCVEYFCPAGNEKTLEEEILKLSKYAGTFPWPQQWLEERKKDYLSWKQQPPQETSWGKYLEEYLLRMLEGCAEKLQVAARLCLEPDGPYMYGELLEQEVEQIEKLLEELKGAGAEFLPRCEALLPAITFKTLSSKRDTTVSPEKRQLAKGLRDQAKKTLSGLSKEFFTTPLELAERRGEACEAPLCTLLELVQEFDRRLKVAKQERKFMDFQDMEHYALEILLRAPEEGERSRDGGMFLCPTQVAREYQEHFQEILIDEYQDSNLVQEYLLAAVSGEHQGNYNRFMVGDVKQCIYKFRLACPELFMEKYHTYGGEEDGESPCRRIDLSQNFRSREPVIRAVNDIFSRIMSREVGGIAYDEHAALYAGAAYPEQENCEPELLLVEKPKTADGQNKKREIRAIAAKIKHLKQTFRVTDKATGQLRPVQYRDMVILLRGTSAWEEELKTELEEEGIPAYIASKTGYFMVQEVQDLLNFLRVLDNPLQDIPLYGVMKSVFGMFAEEEIGAIRSCDRGGSLYEALCAAAGRGEAAEDISLELSKKAASFLECLENYRKAIVYLPIRDLLQKIVNDFDYLNYVTAMPGGAQRRANVEMLFARASDFEKTSYFGLFHFVRYMEQLEKYDVDYGEADLLDEAADVVRIMTIHKSKGLEFPVVFVAGMAQQFHKNEVGSRILADMDLGIGVEYVDPERRIRSNTLRRAVMSRKMCEDNLSEELRILYVALTRAKEKLIMTGTLGNALEKCRQYELENRNIITFAEFMEAGSFLDFLLPLRHHTQIRLTVLDEEDLAVGRLQEQIELGDRRQTLEMAASSTTAGGKEYADQEALAMLRERFAWKYPHENLAGLYTKTTVSELKIAAMAQKDEAAYHAFEEREVVPYLPAFAREQEKVSGAVRGNAYHRVMELLDFRGLLDPLFGEMPADYKSYEKKLAETEKSGVLRVGLEEFLQKEKESLHLSEEYFGVINLGKLIHFLKQPLAWRMWAAAGRGELRKEQPFVLGMDARRLDKDFPEGETVLIQGIIDAFFVEDNQIVLMDYKTDAIGSMEELYNRYNTQLDYYAEALTRLMGLPVKERILYSFHLGR